MLREEELRAWLRLVFFSGIGRTLARHLLTKFSLPEAIFDASSHSLSPWLSDKQLSSLRQPGEAADTAIEAALRWLEPEAGRSILTLGEETYPAVLLDTADPPLLLFAQGNLAALPPPALAIVGSRSATPQGLRDTEAMATSLANSGLVIVSGLADGIDGAAHRGALKSAGEAVTIAVVGTGIDLVYPAKHQALAQAISERGLILSEFMLGARPVGYHFPQRNRIIAGLALGVLVMEAALGSGSLITAKLAAEMGCEVFAVPGSIHSPQARGCHSLVRQGAKLVETAKDVLEDLRLPQKATPRRAVATVESGGRSSEPSQGSEGPGRQSTTPHTTAVSYADLPEECQPVLAAISHAPTAFDDLLQMLDISTGDLNVVLLQLELAGKIERLDGALFQRT